MKQRIKALVLAKKKYREYDELVWLYSEEYGLVSAVIQGIKRKRSKHQGELALFSLVYVEMKMREGLSTIYSFELIDKNVADNTLFLSYTHGASLSELARRILPEREPIQGMLELLVYLFTALPQMKHPELAAVYFKQKILPYTGSQITLTHCAVCGQTTDIVGYSYGLQGLICRGCKHRLLRTDIVDATKIKLLVAFFRSDRKKIVTLALAESDVDFLMTFWRALYEQNLGITLKSEKVLRSIVQAKEEMQC